MADGPTIMTCREARRSGVPMPNRSVAMVISCSLRSQLPVLRPGCARSRLPNYYGRFGFKTSASSPMLRLPDLRPLLWCDGAGGVSTLSADGCLALRSGGSLCQEAVNDLDRLQGASDRDVR